MSDGEPDAEEEDEDNVEADDAEEDSADDEECDAGEEVEEGDSDEEDGDEEEEEDEGEDEEDEEMAEKTPGTNVTTPQRSRKSSVSSKVVSHVQTAVYLTTHRQPGPLNAWLAIFLRQMIKRTRLSPLASRISLSVSCETHVRHLSRPWRQLQCELEMFPVVAAYVGLFERSMVCRFELPAADRRLRSRLGVSGRCDLRRQAFGKGAPTCLRQSCVPLPAGYTV